MKIRSTLPISNRERKPLIGWRDYVLWLAGLISLTFILWSFEYEWRIAEQKSALFHERCLDLRDPSICEVVRKSGKDWDTRMANLELLIAKED